MFALALGFGLVLTRAAIPLAKRFHFTDQPDGRRKLQKAPIPVVGGVALFFAVLAAVLLAAGLSDAVAKVILPDLSAAVWLLASAGLMVGVGVIDDRWQLRARFKLIGQIAAVLPAAIGGYTIHGVTLFGIPLEFGVFAVPMTVLWFLAAVNAINLLDGMDGMLGTLGAIVCGALGLMALVTGNAFSAVLAFGLVGGLLGFLWYNRPPARVYLGDAGSTLIGLLVAALAIRSSVKGAGASVAILAPVALLVLPFLDTAAAIVRRTLTGRGIAIADRGHLHHQLQRSGMSISQSLMWVAGLALLAAAGACLSTYLQNDAVAVIAACGVVALLLVRGLFGLVEARLLTARVRALVSSRVTTADSTETEVALQGVADWERVWERVTAAAANMSLTAVHLDVNAPAWHLGYHRRWQARGHDSDGLSGWRVDLPLVGHGHVLGRLTVYGRRDEIGLNRTMVAAATLVEEVERRIADVVRPLAEPAPVPPRRSVPEPLAAV